MYQTRGPTMILEIRHLKLVAAIAETGSVTRAGNRLHLTQSALSHQLGDAEEQLGVTLFDRANGKMTVTAAGERLLQTARSVLHELDRAESEIKNHGGTAAGLIRLSTQCHTAYHWFPPMLTLFQKKFPAVEVQLVIEATNNPFAALLEGKLDLAIVCDPIRNRKIRYTPLFEDDVVVVVSPKHRLASKNFVTPEDFVGENLLLYPPKEESTLLMEILEPVGVRPRKIQEVMLTEAILEMVMGGLGVAALPRWAAGPQLVSRSLVGLPLQPPGYRWVWSVAQLRARQVPAHVQEFIRLLMDRPLLDLGISGRSKAAKKLSNVRRVAGPNISIAPKQTPNRAGSAPMA